MSRILIRFILVLLVYYSLGIAKDSVLARTINSACPSDEVNRFFDSDIVGQDDQIISSLVARICESRGILWKSEKSEIFLKSNSSDFSNTHGFHLVVGEDGKYYINRSLTLGDIKRIILGESVDLHLYSLFDKSKLILRGKSARLDNDNGRLFSQIRLVIEGEEGKQERSYTAEIAILDHKSIDHVTVMSYNVEMFRNSNSDANQLFQAYRESTSNWADMIGDKASAIAEAIILGDLPDIVSLQEIEDEDALVKNLLPALKPLGFHYFKVAQQNRSSETDLQPPPKSSMTVAIISRIPIENAAEDTTIVIKSPGWNKQGIRNAVFADFRLRTTRQILRVVNSHWYSQLGGSGDRERRYIAQSLNSIVNSWYGEDQDVEIVFLGDFNLSTYELGSEDREGSIGFSMQIRNSKEQLSVEPSYYNLWNEKDAYIYNGVYHGYGTSLDHILLSAELFDSRGYSYVNSSFEVVGQSSGSIAALRLLDELGYPNRWEISEGNSGDGILYFHRGIGISDHLPIIAKINIHAYDDTSSLESEIPKQNVLFKARIAKNLLDFLSEEEMVRVRHVEYGGNLIVHYDDFVMFSETSADIIGQNGSGDMFAYYVNRGVNTAVLVTDSLFHQIEYELQLVLAGYWPVILEAE